MPVPALTVTSPRRSHRAWFTLLAALVALAVTGPASASAAVYAQRYTTNTNGAIAMAANMLETCPSNETGCTAAQAAGTGQDTANSSLQNNGYTMRYVNVDPSGHFDSSSSQLSLPTGSTVLWAGLYWAGDTSLGTNGAAAADPTAEGTALLKVAGASSYATITAGHVDTLTYSGHDAYQAFADVTAQVRAAGAGTYTVANVQAGTGQDRYAGWSLVVAYRDPAGTGRNLTVFDGLSAVGSGNPSSATVSGFHTPGTGPVHASVGVVDYEADLGITGDTATMTSGGVTTPLQDTLTKSDNFANSAIEVGGTRTAAKSPDYSNNLGFDAKVLQLPTGAIPNGATSATIDFSSTGDVYFPGVVTVQTDLYSPHLQPLKTATDVSNGSLGGSPINARPGDTVRYEVSATNTGEDGAAGVTVSDPIPSGVTYVPGSLQLVQDSDHTGAVGPQTDGVGDDVADYDAVANAVTFRLGSGANASSGGGIAPGSSFKLAFDVTVDRSLAVGTQVDNVASVTYAAASNPAFVQTSSTSPPTSLSVATAPDLFVGIARDHGLVRGGVTSYTVTATNGGTGATDTSPATRVVTTFPAGETPAAPASAPGWTCSVAGQAVTCTRTDALAAGRSHPAIVIPVTVAQGASGSLTAQTVVSGGGDSTPGNDTADDTAGVTSRADLAVTQTVSDAAPAPGTDDTFTVRVDNGGPSDAAAVQLADTLPAGLTLVSATPSQGTCDASGACALGALASGGHATVVVVAHVTGAAQGQTVANQAAASTSTPDPDQANDTSTRSVTVPDALRLTLDLTGAPGTVDPGETVTYSLTARNAGPATATSTSIADTLPAGMTFVSASAGCAATGQVVTCPAGTLAPGDSATVTVTARATDAVQGQSVTNAGQVSAQQPNTDPQAGTATATTAVTAIADLELSDAVSGTVTAGQPATYTLTVVNHGPSPATGIELEDALPAGARFVSATPAQGTCAPARGTIHCALGSLPVGGSTQVSVVVIPGGDAVGSLLTDAARAWSAEHASHPAAASASASARVVAPPAAAPARADLAVTAGTTGPVRLDEPATYVVRVTNGGPDLAQAVQLAQTFAGRARVLSVSTSQGTCTIDPVVHCSLGDIALGATATVRIRLVPLAAGEVKGATAVLGATADVKRLNNRTTRAIAVRVRPVHVRLAVRPSARRAVPGQRLRLVVTARDRGPGRAVGMQVCTRLPAGLIFVRSPHAAFRSGQVCWPREDLGVDRRTRHVLRVQVSPAARRGRLVATARVDGDNARHVRVRAGVQVAGELSGRSGGVTG